MASDACNEWLQKASGLHQIDYILSLDTDDPTRHDYKRLPFPENSIIISENRSIVDAVNTAAKLSEEPDVYVVMSDDFGCPDQWDSLIAQQMDGRLDCVLHVHDGNSGDLATLPIVGKDYYKEAGFIYFPEYFSMFCDTDLTYCARAKGKLIDARHIQFEHRHYSNGKNAFDETYKRENSQMAWNIGEAIFNKRLAINFGV